MELIFRTSKGARAWAVAFQRTSKWILAIRRVREAQVFNRTKGVWILEIPEAAEAEFTKWAGQLMGDRRVINQ